MEPARRSASLTSIIGIGGTVAVLALLAGFFFISNLRFGRGSVIKRVEKGTGARVQVADFHRNWFPPGFTANNVRLQDPTGAVLSIGDITARGSYAGLLRPKTLAEVRVTGLHLTLPPFRHGGPVPFSSSGSKSDIGVDQLRLRDGTIELQLRTPGKAPLVFSISALTLENVGSGKRTQYHLAFRNPEPKGDIRSDGEFGPIDKQRPEQTPISGSFHFDNADLTIHHGISGILNASGKFQGPFNGIACSGTADMPKFQVFGSSHAVHLASTFDAVVDARNGNITLNKVISHFNATTVSTTGKIMSSPRQEGKTASIEMSVNNGRVEDLLLLFSHGVRPAMNGFVRLKGKFTLPPGPADFLTRLGIDGAFQITHAHFLNPTTQTEIDRLSASAEGESKKEIEEGTPLVPTDIRASVSDRNGVAALRNIVFDAPGIHGGLEGTFALHGRDINLSGVLETTGKLSDTTSGPKSLLLKVLGPFWHKQASVQTIPFHIGGKASHPVFRLKLHG